MIAGNLVIIVVFAMNERYFLTPRNLFVPIKEGLTDGLTALGGEQRQGLHARSGLVVKDGLSSLGGRQTLLYSVSLQNYYAASDRHYLKCHASYACILWPTRSHYPVYSNFVITH